MSGSRLIVRARNRPDVLERVSGLLRRRAFAIIRLSMAFAGDDVIQFVVSIDQRKTDPLRVTHELQTLRDVIGIVPEDISGAETREFLLARLKERRGGADEPRGGGVFEMIGAPGEIDSVLEQLQAHGMIIDFVRSGELAVPGHPSPTENRGTTWAS